MNLSKRLASPLAILIAGGCDIGGGLPTPETHHRYELQVVGAGARSCDAFLDAGPVAALRTLAPTPGIHLVENYRGARLAVSFLRREGGMVEGKVASLAGTATGGATTTDIRPKLISSVCYDEQGRPLSPAVIVTKAAAP